jgi:hypothetical protein
LQHAGGLGERDVGQEALADDTLLGSAARSSMASMRTLTTAGSAVVMCEYRRHRCSPRGWADTARKPLGASTLKPVAGWIVTLATAAAEVGLRRATPRAGPPRR